MAETTKKYTIDGMEFIATYDDSGKLISAERSSDSSDDENSAKEATNGRSVISAKMAEAAGIINKVIDGLTDEPIYATFLDFKVNSLHVNTSSQSPDTTLLMSFEIEKNGSGLANSFTIRIGYAPNPGDYGSMYNINLIDSALEAAVTSTGTTYSSRYCELSYGYASLNGKRCVTPVYTGMVIDYSCEIQDGTLIYVITGYSSLVYEKESKKPFQLNMPAECKPTTAAKKLIETYMTEYTHEFDEGVFESDCKAPFVDPMDKNPSRALTEILNQAVHSSQAKYLEGATIPDDELITYEWFVSDAKDGDKKGKIYITMNAPNVDKQAKADANIVFDWMGNASGNNSRNIVLNFKPEFKGSVRLSIIAAKVNEGLEESTEDGTETGTDTTPDSSGDSEATTTEPASEDKTESDEAAKAQEVADAIASGNMFVNDEGKLEVIFDSRSPATGGEMKAVTTGLKREKSSWVHEAQYPYRATMTTMGIPYDIPITGRIKVVPLIYGMAHHSAGIYQVLSTADYIDGGGQYTTSWNLMKLVQVKDEGNITQTNAAKAYDLTPGPTDYSNVEFDRTQAARRRQTN